MHPTVKPVAFVADAIKDCSRRGGFVLDPFCGSGTILIAAERTGRKAGALEVDPTYVDVGVRRWQNYSGKSAVLKAIEEQRAATPVDCLIKPASTRPRAFFPASLSGR